MESIKPVKCKVGKLKPIKQRSANTEVICILAIAVLAITALVVTTK